ncbi:hypothetical protein PYCC9005_002803 [Savitreella phatthalungensis]
MLLAPLLALLVTCLAQRPTPRQSISAPQTGARASDGSLIVEGESVVNGLTLRWKVSGPDDQFVVGGAGAKTDKPARGLAVLLHGDGGASFEAMPGAAISQSYAGELLDVVVLAPNNELVWGGRRTDSRGMRTQAVAHADALDILIDRELPRVVRFDRAKVSFTGVSGGSILLASAFLPRHLGKYASEGGGNGVMLLCGGDAPAAGAAALQDFATAVARTRLRWQVTDNELPQLKRTIPRGIRAYAALDTGKTAVQTVFSSPGSHCAFTNGGFNDGIQRVVSNWREVMFGQGGVPGLGNVRVQVTPQTSNPFTRQ